MNPHPHHLDPALLDRAQRELLAKAIGELAHERLLTPVPDPGAGADCWRVEGPRSVHAFRARRHLLDHWVVDPGSVRRTVEGRECPPDVQAFVAEHAAALGLTEALLPTYLEELASTLAATMWKLDNERLTAPDLVHASHQEVEAAMTAGHPSFVANSGRIGFGLDDYLACSPESGRDLHLHWLAARRAHTHLSCGAGLDEDTLYATELGDAERARFAATLTGLGLSPEDYLYLPVHPWQWQHKVAVTFAPDLARHDLVHLGPGDDAHRPQQSIRTFANSSRPDRRLVKTALAIQNMGFLRGLSPAYMRATPAVNDWVAALVAKDDELRARGFTVLPEVAAVGYTGDAFHALDVAGPQRKMIAALWRDSLETVTAPGERPATMAALLHRDRAGRSLAGELVRASGLEARAWVRRYLDAYLRPLVHCLVRYDLAFMPHGENLVMVLRDHVPVRMVMKDIGEEMAVLGDLPLPAEIERIRADVPPEDRSLSVLTDVFDGFLRHLAALLDDDGLLPAEDFWAEVHDCVAGHHADHPDLAGRAAAYDLLREEFRHSCLNRLQLRNTLQMLDLADQASGLMFAGTLENPAAAVRRPRPPAPRGGGAHPARR